MNNTYLYPQVANYKLHEGDGNGDGDCDGVDSNNNDNSDKLLNK